MVDITALLNAAVAETADSESTLVLAGTEVKLFASALTPNDMKIIGRKHPNFMMNPTMEGMVDLIILKARGSDGQKMFTLEHRPLLMRLPSASVTGVFGELFGEQMTPEDDETRKGNSKATA
jgi:hypothetical protein